MQSSLFEPEVTTRETIQALRPLRDYQENSYAKVRKSLLRWRCPVLYLPTGAGKTQIAVQIIANALERGKRVLFVVPLLSLIKKTIDTLESQGITNVGVIQRQHVRTNHAARVQVASKQTLIKRPALMQGFDLVLDDECHRMYDDFSEWMKRDKKTVFIGLSASPGTKGMGRVWGGVVIGATITELLAKGAICPLEVYDSGSPPSRARVKVVNGEFSEKQTEEIMSRDTLVADVYEMWVERGSIPKWFVFAQTCAHAKLIVESFTAKGVSCGYIDANTPQDERDSDNSYSDAILCRYRRGEIDVMVSVGCLGTGVDEVVNGISLAYMTKSRDKLTQDLGRGGRPSAGKKVCVVNDHGGNIEALGEPEYYDYSEMDKSDPTEQGDARIDLQEPPKAKKCGKCRMVLPPKTSICPKCGEKPTVCTVETVSGKLVRREKKPKPNPLHQRWYSELLHAGRKAGFKEGWAAFKFKEKFGIMPDGLKVRGKSATSDEVKVFVAQQRAKYLASKGAIQR